MTLSEYYKLKQNIEVNVGKCDRHGYLIQKLKEMFKDKINSPRRYEIINSITELLTILEIRDIISESDVTALKEIAKIMPNSNELLRQINDYENNQTLHTNFGMVFYLLLFIYCIFCYFSLIYCKSY